MKEEVVITHCEERGKRKSGKSRKSNNKCNNISVTEFVPAENMSKLLKKENILVAQNAREENNGSEKNNESPQNCINFSIAESIVDFLIESIPVNIENETEKGNTIGKHYCANLIAESIPLEIEDELNNRYDVKIVKSITRNVKKCKTPKSMALVESILNSLIESILVDVTNHEICKKCGCKYGYLFKTENKMCKACFKKKSKKERFRLKTREKATRKL